MLPPNSTVRTVDIFCPRGWDGRLNVSVTSVDCYVTTSGESNRWLTASYQRPESFLRTMRYFREHGYEKAGKLNTTPNGVSLRLERTTVPDFPMPFIPAKYTILDDKEMPF